ncbi:MAG TPA: flagellar biosynthesis protein FlhB [Longimicrobiales bacterium]|nr:flagellar biosynthesis protein FlhB [Longimicrobiales bacterium]
MSAESFQEKTEAPTPRRREDARKKGQVARSPEVTTAILLLVAAVVAQVSIRPLTETVVAIFGHSARMGAAMPVGIPGTAEWVRGIGWQVLGVVAVPTLALAATAVLVGAAQARGVLSLKPIEPDWSRLAPHNNLKRIFGIRSLAELGKSVLKLVIVGCAVYFALSSAWEELLALPQKSPAALAEVARRYGVRVLMTAGAAYLALAAADYFFQLRQFEKSLRMSREEVKQEHKETEGDPMIRARLRSMGRALARRQMLRAVPTADVVVTNPTRIAVALKYDPAKAPAPIVLAMGQRKIAQRIREIALAAGVPIVENRPLARAMLASCRVGQPIPVELYVAVAEVLAYVMRRRAGGLAGIERVIE